MFTGRGSHRRRTPQAPGFVALHHNLVGTGDSLSILPASTSSQPSTNAPATTSTKEDQGRWIRPEKRWAKDSRAHAMQDEQSSRDAYKERKAMEKITKKAAKDLQRREEDEKKKLEEEDLAALIRGIPLVPGVQSRALESARKIYYFEGMRYPEGFNAPSAGLNMGQGRYTYDRDFMLQFMPICRDKPRFASNLDGLGVERPDKNESQAPSGSRNLVSNVATRSVQGVNGAHGDRHSTGLSPREVNRIRSERGRQRKQRNEDASVGVATPENRFTSWSVGRKNRSQDTNSPEFVERKVKALLNKITPQNYDSISNQVINWVNNAEGEKSGNVLDLAARLVLEQAAATALFSETFARMSRKMMEKCSASIQDSNVRNAAGEPILGGHLFRKYLLSRCKEYSELCWSFDRAGSTDPSTQDHKSEGQPIMFSDEYYAICKAKREGLNLIRFMGELFKVQLLTERIMHETIKQLLAKINDPREEEIERLCILLATIGQKLDTPKAKGHVNVYLGKMEKSVDNNKLSPRLRCKLLDVIELRKRNWIPRGTVLESPATIQLHEQGVKEAHGTTQEQQADKPTRKSRGKKSPSHVTSGNSVTLAL